MIASLVALLALPQEEEEPVPTTYEILEDRNGHEWLHIRQKDDVRQLIRIDTIVGVLLDQNQSAHIHFSGGKFRADILDPEELDRYFFGQEFGRSPPSNTED